MVVASTTAIGIALASPPASALIVFDPSNYAENVLTAARSLEQINNQIASLQNEAQMLINQAKNLTSLPTSILSEIEGNFSEMKALLGEAEKLAYSVQDIESQFASTYRDFAADKSGEQLVASARERWQQSVSAFEHSLKAGAVAVENIEGTRSQSSSLVDASQSAVGVLQATQAGNQLLAVQAAQVADLTAMLAAQGRAAALEQARQAAAQEQAREQFSRFMNGRRYSPSAVRMFHD
ncbi:P-type conjugative transfer protein TrbJ [Chelativorans sp. AA-79]|uniref:P-type conjugative transfer protein TrbJ n=1 Tax=Chelativorans sp. AA-79 TaxID=3028735 RepID=UPI0023F95215|nr:P-type conjugative transfer protein TrbJ [Chelativorans sp. AA-79]WEX11989.1 P-type conjugative transfer protein TrbJ [Chelativorans sp. AA-79]